MGGAVRTIGAAVLGVVVFFVVGSIFGIAMRALWPDYEAARATYAFTLPMLVARLGVGVVSALAAGAAAKLVAKNGALLTGVVLVLLFAPMHYYLRAEFPLWYHGVFLLTLIPLTLIGGGMAQGRG